MKHLFFAILLLSASGIMFFSCAKYKDAKAINLNLTRPYCNDPRAVNYDDSFPGKPDNTVCIYPSNLFAGVYVFHDSVYNDSSMFIAYDSLVLRIHAISDSQISMTGFAPDITFQNTLTAKLTLIAYVDTNAVDTSTGLSGQTLGVSSPGIDDTLSGTMRRDATDTGILHVSFTVVGKQGTNTHVGTAYKQ